MTPLLFLKSYKNRAGINTNQWLILLLCCLNQPHYTTRAQGFLHELSKLSVSCLPHKLLKVVDVFYKCVSIEEGICFGKSNIRFDTIINIIERAIFNGCQLFWPGNLENGSGSGRARQYNTGSSTRTLSHQCHLTGCLEGCRYRMRMKFRIPDSTGYTS